MVHPFYSTPSSKTELFQGDIFDDIPVLFPSSVGPWILLRPGPWGKTPPSPKEALAGRTPQGFVPRGETGLADAWSYGATEFVLARAENVSVMVLTQSCDISQRKTYQVAPVKPVSGLEGTKVETLRAGRIKYMFYLPAMTLAGAESFVNLSLMTTVHKSYFEGRTPIARLTEASASCLRRHLSEFHGRPFGFDGSDPVPAAGMYQCVYCFFAAGVLTQKEFAAGEGFKSCARGCDPMQWIDLPGTRAR